MSSAERIRTRQLETPASPSRRRFLAGAGTLFAFAVGGKVLWLTPTQARAQGLPFSVLTPAEAAGFSALGETLVPGANEAGMAHYLDSQLALPITESKLMVRYLGVEPPFTDFYRTGMASLNALSLAATGQDFAAAEPADRQRLVRDISAAQPDGWVGPPAPLFYFALRADAVDVAYGTLRGFDRLNVPYMPHILPSSQAW